MRRRPVKLKPWSAKIGKYGNPPETKLKKDFLLRSGVPIEARRAILRDRVRRYGLGHRYC